MTPDIREFTFLFIHMGISSREQTSIWSSGKKENIQGEPVIREISGWPMYTLTQG